MPSAAGASAGSAGGLILSDVFSACVMKALNQARYQSGLASLFELEDSRRTLFAAQTARVSLQRERTEAWVALYRSMGGGWARPESPSMTSNPTAKVATSP